MLLMDGMAHRWADIIKNKEEIKSSRFCFLRLQFVQSFKVEMS
jgi:hypothetical protein